MSSSYKLYKSNYSNDDNQYYAKVQHHEVMTEEDIIDMMMLNGSPFSKADTQAIINKYHDTINIAARNGRQVVTRNVRYSFTIKGVFNGPQDQLDSHRHQIVANVLPGPDFKEAVENGVPIAKEAAYKKRPELDGCVNLHKGASDAELSPGHNARIIGNQLRFDQDDPLQGLFIVPVDDNGITHHSQAVRVEEFARIAPKEITFRVPDTLSPGLYKLEVRAKYRRSSLRTGQLETVLTVR